MYRMEVAVNSHLKHPLILGTDWPAFTQLLGIVCADVSWQMGRGQEEAAAQTGEALAVPSPPASEETTASEVMKPGAVAGRDAQKRVWSGPLHWRAASPARRPPLLPLFFPYKREVVSGNPRCPVKGDDNPIISPQEGTVFQAAHCTPMAGPLGEAKTRKRLLARFLWPGIHENVRRWCVACRECQLVNPPATAKAPLRPLPLMEVPFERIGMDLIGPLERFGDIALP